MTVTPASLRAYAYPAALAVILSVFAIFCARGLAAPWHWGHNGYNGAAFSQAAKNSLRHGLAGQALYHFEDAPPAAETIYTHHPLALHGHLVATFALFGEQEWAARVVPFAYSIASLWLLVVLVRRYWGKSAAALTGAVYAVAPINVIFGNMVSHEHGGIFACLVVVALYLRWLDTGRRALVWWCAAAITFAAQWDWPAYYIAFALAAHCLVLGLRAKAPNGWRFFLVVFSGVTLVNFVGFFLWIYATRGSLEDMLFAFDARSRRESWTEYTEMIGRYLRDLQGAAILSAAGVGGLVGVGTALRDGLRHRLALPVAFAFAGAVHVVAFPHAARLHAYWIYYWGPVIAIAAATGLLGAAEFVANAVSQATRARWVRAVSVIAVFVAFFAMQVPYTLRAWHRQLDHGHAATCEECYFQRFERLWFTSLAAHFDARPGDVRYAIHSSVHQPRIELRYYLDAPHRPIESLQDARPDEVLLVDAFGLSAQERAFVDALVGRHATGIWASRFYAIDLRSSQRRVERFVATLQRPTLLRWWLTTQTDDTPATWQAARPGSTNDG